MLYCPARTRMPRHGRHLRLHGYLAGQLDHAQDILADLVDTIVGGFRPPFQLSKLEGDAAFVYLVAPEFDGSHLQDTIEMRISIPPAARDIKQASSANATPAGYPDARSQVHRPLRADRQADHVRAGGADRPRRDPGSSPAEERQAKLARHAYILYTDAFAQRTGMNPQAQG